MPSMRTIALGLVTVAVLACKRGPAAAATDAGAAAQPGSACAERRDIAARPALERIADGGACITLVRVSPERWTLRLLTALAEGGPRPAPAWVDTFHLVAAINASMFQPDFRSIGLLVAAGVENNPRDNAKLGAFFAFDPVAADDPPWLLVGRGCPDVDVGDVRRRYRSVVQNYRMLDCDGRPVDWQDDKRHSVAAVGIDRDGRVVLVLAPRPHRVRELAERMAAPEVGMRALMYVEGGPEASLYVKTAAVTVAEIGRM